MGLSKLYRVKLEKTCKCIYSEAAFFESKNLIMNSPRFCEALGKIIQAAIFYCRAHKTKTEILTWNLEAEV